MNNKQKENNIPAAQVRKLASPWCFYIAGGVFLLWALIFPFYKMTHYLLAGGFAALAWFAASKLLPPEVVEIEPEPVTTGDDLADRAVQEGRAYLAQLDGIREAIKAIPVQSALLSIDGTVEKILHAIEEEPRKAPMVRKLMSYYLPTLIKLTDYYRKLELQGGEGENIAGSMERIEGNLAALDLALRRQLDLMYERDALDISTDITVMENMLAREGLTDGPLQPQAAETEGITLTLNDEE